MKRPLLAIAGAAAMLLAACGSSDNSSSGTTAAAATTAAAPATEAPATTAAPAGSEAPGTTEAPAAGGGMIQKAGECGTGTGQKATGEPIKLGGMATKSPIADFTWITGMTKAYFDCVNDNGGINGRPISYTSYEEQSDNQQVAGFAKKLIEDDQVLGIVGSTSLSECAVNKDYYAQQNYYLIIAGVAQACFESPNFSAVNMGPYYSSLGGAQAAVRAGAKGTIVIASPNAPGFDAVNQGVLDYAKQNGMEGKSVLENPPFPDAPGFAQKLVQDAGEGGAVVLDYTGPNVEPLLEAIAQQGLIDKVIWASSTPPNDPSVSAALKACCGTDWDGKFLINAEFNVLDSGKPDQNHMNEIREKYASSIPSSSFAQMGYLAGRTATEALLGIQGDITKESVNAAFKGLKNITSDLWCKPWYFDSTVGKNVSNNVDITVVPKDGNMVQTEDCFEIAAMPANPLDAIRAKETELGLNTGG